MSDKCGECGRPFNTNERGHYEETRLRMPDHVWRCESCWRAWVKAEHERRAPEREAEQKRADEAMVVPDEEDSR